MNLLNLAMTAIPTQTIQWIQYAGTVTDDRGRETATYRDPVPLQASVQPVSARDYEQFGLDASRQYYTVWASRPMQSVERSQSPDRFSYNGMDLEAVGMSGEWYAHNGWRAVMCVKI